jgi:DNA-directed RNA polymerase subunit RPC12/RpoP
MNDFIAMSCPSCGGQLQVRKDLQKYFCMYCGSELLLKQDSEGVFSTMQARDLQASAKLKEIQFSVTAMELLKSQVSEVENQIKTIRTTFLEYYEKIYTGSFNHRYVSDYEKEKRLPLKLQDVYAANYLNWGTCLQRNISGYTTADELMEFYQYIQQPCYKRDKYLTTLIGIFEPLPPLVEQLRQKKTQLNHMLEQAINQ